MTFNFGGATCTGKYGTGMSGRLWNLCTLTVFVSTDRVQYDCFLVKSVCMTTGPWLYSYPPSPLHMHSITDLTLRGPDVTYSETSI